MLKYTELAEPFANLRKKNVFIWSEKQQEAFDRSKVIKAKKPVVIFFLSVAHYFNLRCKRTFNIWSIITRRASNNVFIKKTNKH